MTLFKHELKSNLKTLFIWSLSVGIICFGTLLLFESLKSTMDEMADMYSQMGAFSTALGLDRFSIGTIEGFYATEIALMFAIGGAMFAAMTGASLLSKEEEGHTGEFLHTLPLGRTQIVLAKYVALAVLIAGFQIICLCWILLGFAGVGEMPDVKSFAIYHGAQFLMQLEIGSICFLMSSLCKKRQIGAALGLALLFYMADLLCRVLPDIENLKYITPYYFSNAADIFTSGTIPGEMAAISIAVTLLCIFGAWFIYNRRDISA